MKLTRKHEIDAAAAVFSNKHPEVNELFVRFTTEIINRGFKNYSVSAIFERIRWETDQADVDGKSTFKLNNNYRAWYARRFMEHNPEHAGFFRTRRRTSALQDALGLYELTPEDFEYETR